MIPFSESTIQLSALPPHKKRPHVPGLAVGDVVFSHYGRRMRVEKTNEFVLTGTNAARDTATGPYCSVRALDDSNAGGIWPRHWYAQRGETMQLDLSGAP